MVPRKRASSRRSNATTARPVEMQHPTAEAPTIAEAPVQQPEAPPPSQPAMGVALDQLNLLVQQVQTLTAALQAKKQANAAPWEAPQPAPPQPPHSSERERQSRLSQPRSPNPSSQFGKDSTLSQPRSPNPSSQFGKDSTPGCSPPRHSKVCTARYAVIDRRLREMEQQIEALSNQAPTQDGKLGFNAGPPFSTKIMQEPIPSDFELPELETYDGSTDPTDHLWRFNALMLLYGTTDGIMCRAFPCTLRKTALHWFSSLKPNSIHSFEQLSRSFVERFAFAAYLASNNSNVQSFANNNSNVQSFANNNSNVQYFASNNRNTSSRASQTVYVGNLPRDIREREVEDLFYEYGPIVNIDLKIPPRRPGYAFIEFEDVCEAEDAIHGRDGYNFDGHRLRVELAHGGRGSRRSEYCVLVTGLPSSASWQDLKDHMRRAGDVCFSEVFCDGRGTTGIVDYTNYDDMKYAVRKLDDSEFRNAFSRAYIRVREYDQRRSVSRSRSYSYSRSSSPSCSRSYSHSSSYR